MASSTQQLELIRQVCKVRRLDEDDTFIITRRLLEYFRSALWLHSGAADVAKVILTTDGKRQVKEWYLALKELTKEEQIVASIDSAIFHICRTAWITEVMDRVLSSVRDFNPFGELYHDILQLAYFDEKNMSDQGVSDELNLERSTYYRRKKEAILLCGILLWDEVRDKRFA